MIPEILPAETPVQIKIFEKTDLAETKQISEI